MDNAKLRALLKRKSACQDAVDWIGKRAPKQAWDTCSRGDWMLWLAGRIGIDRKLLVLAACDCAEPALKFVRKGEDRPAQAIRTARLWCGGKATLKEVRADADAAVNAAVYAAAAYAAVDAAAYAADRNKSLQHSANLVRKRIPWTVIKAALPEKDGE